jgi:hypothetical protein
MFYSEVLKPNLKAEIWDTNVESSDMQMAFR